MAYVGKPTLTASVRQSLLSLQNTQDMVGRTQKRLSSGLEVENAIDDAISYFHPDYASSTEIFIKDGELTQLILGDDKKTIINL